MYVTVEAEREARISDKIYPLATVLNPKPNRSIRSTSWPRMAMRVLSLAIIVTGLLALFVLAS